MSKQYILLIFFCILGLTACICLGCHDAYDSNGHCKPYHQLSDQEKSQWILHVNGIKTQKQLLEEEYQQKQQIVNKDNVNTVNSKGFRIGPRVSVGPRYEFGENGGFTIGPKLKLGPSYDF